MKLFFLAAALSPLSVYAHLAGPDVRHTAAPGDDQLSCATSGCHTNASRGGPLNPAGGKVVATFSSGTTYTPGQVITITVTVSDPANTHFGFQMSARLASNLSNGQAGDFTSNGANQIVLCDDNSTIKTATRACPASAPVQFIEHYYSRDPTSTTPFTFTWTAPASNVGDVHFYVAGNANNNNDQSDGGDHIYTADYVLTAAAAGFTCTNTTAPVITSVNSATDFGGFTTFASGSWLEIKGTNLSDPADPRNLWAGGDFNGSNAPTSLDGVSALVNGKSAFTYYISAGQINVQAPDDATNGPVSITVKNCNATSSPMSVTKAALVPGVLAPASFNIGGKQFLVAQHTDNSFVLTAGSIAGLATAPAKPGESISVYGVGFGPATQGGTAVPSGFVAPYPTTLATSCDDLVRIHSGNDRVPGAGARQHRTLPVQLHCARAREWGLPDQVRPRGADAAADGILIRQKLTDRKLKKWGAGGSGSPLLTVDFR